MIEKQYNATKLHKELEAAGLLIEGVSNDGRVDWLEAPTVEMITKADQVTAAHPEVEPAEERRQAYLEKGLDAERLVVALWEKIMEGRPEAADQIQLIRNGIKKIAWRYLNDTHPYFHWSESEVQ